MFHVPPPSARPYRSLARSSLWRVKHRAAFRLILDGRYFWTNTVCKQAQLNEARLKEATQSEDLDLLTIRSRGSTSRVLEPLEASEQSMWEFANYGFALIALVIIGVWWASRRRAEQPMQLTANPFDHSDQTDHAN